jgi:hypothetical protein
LKLLDSRCSLPLSVVIEGGNDVSKKIRGFYELIMFKSLLSLFRSDNNNPEARAASARIDRLVDIADPAIRQARRFHSALVDPIEAAASYCNSMTEQIPGPLVLDRNTYYNDPSVKPLFASYDEMQLLLHHHQNTKAELPTGENGKAVALLTMIQEEKTIFAPRQTGDLIEKDVMQKSVNFSDHRLVAVSDSLADAKGWVTDRGLDVLATYAMEQITQLKTKKAELREKIAYLRGASTIVSGKIRAHGGFGVPDPALEEKLDTIRTTLASAEKELTQTNELLSYPDDSLKYLIRVLQTAADLLTVDHSTFRLDWKNVVVDDSDETGKDTILAKFSLSDELTRYAVFVTFTPET